MSFTENQENINPNNLSTLSSVTLSSLSGLEELIKGVHPPDKSGQTDLVQKLKALQLIEQMICTQEQLLSGDQGDEGESKQSTHPALSKTGNDASPLASTCDRQAASEQVPSEQVPRAHLSPLPMKSPPDSTPVHPRSLDDLAVNRRGVLSNEKVGESVFSSNTSKEEVADLSQRSAGAQFSGHCVGMRARPPDGEGPSQLRLKERKEEKLRLLNEKIAQRHSKLPRKTDFAGKPTQSSTKLTASAAVSKKTTRKQDSSKPKLSGATDHKPRLSGRDKNGSRKMKGAAKGVGKLLPSSKSAPVVQNPRSASSSNVPPSCVPLSHAPPSHVPLSHAPPSHVPPSKQPTSLQGRHQVNSPQLNSPRVSGQYTPTDDIISAALQSTSSSQLVKVEETTAAHDSDLLDSTSYLIPVDGGGDGDETLLADSGAMPGEDSAFSPDTKKEEDVSYEDDSLASTLTHAYGLSTHSDLLSTLATSHEEEPRSCASDRSAHSKEEVISTSKELEEENLPVSLVQVSSSLVPMSTTTEHKAATVIQAAWYISYSNGYSYVNGVYFQAWLPCQEEGPRGIQGLRRIKQNEVGDLCCYYVLTTSRVSCFLVRQ